MRYGFVEPSCPVDVYRFAPGDFGQALKDLGGGENGDSGIAPTAAQRVALEAAGLWATGIEGAACARNGFGRETLGAARVLATTGAAAEAALASPSATLAAADRDGDVAKADPAREGRVLRLLADLCDAEATRPGRTSLAQDEALLSSRAASDALPKRERTALLFRVEKKRLLAEGAASMRARANKWDARAKRG